MNGISGIKGRSRVPLTIAVKVYYNAIDNLTNLLHYFRKDGKIYLYATRDKCEIRSRPLEGKPHICLTVSVNNQIGNALTSTNAHNILVARGYGSVFSITDVKVNGAVDPGIVEFVRTQVVVQANINALNSIVRALAHPRMITRNEDAGFCDRISAWAKDHDPNGEVITLYQDGSVLIREMQSHDLATLRAAFEPLKRAHLRKHETTTTPAAVPFAETKLPIGFEPWGTAVMGNNIMEIFPLIPNKARPVNINLAVNLENGSAKKVDDYRSANVILAPSVKTIVVFNLNDKLRDLLLDLKITNITLYLISEIAIAKPIYADEKKKAFIGETARRLNDQLCENLLRLIKSSALQQGKKISEAEIKSIRDALLSDEISVSPL